MVPEVSLKNFNFHFISLFYFKDTRMLSGYKQRLSYLKIEQTTHNNQTDKQTNLNAKKKFNDIFLQHSRLFKFKV